MTMTRPERLKFDDLHVPLQLLIDGQWRDAANGKTSVVDNPSDEQEIAVVADAGAEDGAAAVAAAAAAFAGWAATAPRERAEILRRCFTLMHQHREALARLISMENGKSLSDARGEVTYAAEFFRWYSEEAVRLNGEVTIAPSGVNRILVEQQPVGVCLLITPWNFPAAMATRKIAPALAAGCATILKPAPQTPLTALAVAELMIEAGVPAGVVNVLPSTDAPSLVEPMLADSRVRKLSFTGSTAVGRLLLQQAANSVVKCSMELGGNAPVLVFKDADLDLALYGVMMAKMRNGGQACTAANRVYVQRGVQAEFTHRLSERMGAMRVGAGTDLATEVGPLIDRRSVQKVEALVADAVDLGAQVVLGGKAPDGAGFYYPPTVLTEVPPVARMVREEIFGPVAAIIGFDNEEDAIAAANDSEHGLAAYVFTEDLRRGLRVSERLESGMVGINRGLISDPAAPFGGVKQSGLGREGAHQGMLDFTETKYIAVEW